MAGDIRARAGMREASISAVIIRADGRREDLGRISYWHRNPLRRWLWRLRRFLSRATTEVCGGGRTSQRG
jgi:hypothetical protein